jgi:ATP-dependent DNA helicase RecQ
VAQKILSCVARVGAGFDARHLVRVLRASDTEGVKRHGHDRLSTFGLLRDHSAEQVHDWVAQLVEQGALSADRTVNPVLSLNATSWAVMRGQAPVRLVRLVAEEQAAAAAAEQDAAAWAGVDRDLFTALEAARDHIAAERQLEHKEILHDWVLRELARVRPSTPERMRLVSGLGDARLALYGSELLAVIIDHCDSRSVPIDQPAGPSKTQWEPRKTRAAPEERERAFALYARGATVEEVTRETEWSRSKALDYLQEYVRARRPASLTPWVSDEVRDRVASAARRVGTDRLKPIYLALGEQVPYDDIRLVVAQLAAPAVEPG